MNRPTHQGGRMQFFFVTEVARALRMHPKTVRRFIQKGHLRAHRLGSERSRWRVSQAALEAFLDPPGCPG